MGTNAATFPTTDTNVANVSPRPRAWPIESNGTMATQTAGSRPETAPSGSSDRTTMKAIHATSSDAGEQGGSGHRASDDAGAARVTRRQRHRAARTMP